MAKKKKGLFLSSKVKFRKSRKGLTYLHHPGTLFKNSVLQQYRCAVKASEEGVLTRGQIEAARVYLRRPLKKLGFSRFWVRVFPDRIITKRSQGTRMGRGKGAPFSQICLVKKGQILFEFDAPRPALFSKFFFKAASKLSVRTQLVF
jgi:large subunit ribosomal protein L16